MAANFHKKLVKYGVLILRTLYCSFKVVCIDGVDNCTGQLWKGSVDRSFLVLIKINPIVESGYFCSKHKTWSLHCCSCCESKCRRVWPGATEFKSLNDPIVESGYFCRKYKTWSLHCCSCCESKCRRVWPGATELKSLNDPIVESGYFCRKYKTWSLHCCSCCESKCRRVWPGATELKSLNVIPPVTLVPWRSICCPSFKVLKRFSQFSYPR